MSVGQDDAVLAPARLRPERRGPSSWVLPGLRVVFVVATVAAIALSFYSHPRTGTVAGLRHDLVDHQVTAIEVVVSERSSVRLQPWRLPDHTPPVPYIEWVTSDYRVHDARLGPGGFSGAEPIDQPITHAELIPRALRGDIAAWLADEQRAGTAGRIRAGGGVDAAGSGVMIWVGPNTTVNPVGILTLICLLALLVGPKPVRGTKWAWFWFAGLMPAGLGVLAWLAFERPWTTPTGVTRRRTGWAGLGWGLLGATAASAVVTLLFWS